MESVHYPTVESTGELPQVEDGGVLVGGERALDYMRGRCKLDAALSPLHASLSLGLLPLVQGHLGDVERWFELRPGEARTGVLQAIGRRTPAPFSYLFVRSIKASLEARLLRSGMVDEAGVKVRAEAAYAVLERVLRAELDKPEGGGPFFFGARWVRRAASLHYAPSPPPLPPQPFFSVGVNPPPLLSHPPLFADPAPSTLPCLATLQS